jgi:hypothetical protein
MATLTLRIDNMHCGSCIRRVTQTLNTLLDTHAEEVRVGSAASPLQPRPSKSSRPSTPQATPPS